MNDNTILHDAKRNKKDEFYTQLVDIENELRHYKEHFKDKTVYCNCDDPYESNFFKYFAAKFNTLGLKRLIATSYIDSSIRGDQVALDNGERKAYKIDIREVDDFDEDGAVGLSDVEWLLKNDVNTVEPLLGDGDFRNDECVELLLESDIVVTNPPFSLFREYVDQLMYYEKKFLIIGDQNAITYKKIFNYIKNNKMWLGNDNGGTKWFRVPMDYDIQTESRKKVEKGIKYISMGRIVWFTNLDYSKRHEELILTKKYSPEEHPKYDNIDAIEVSKVKNIPKDYDGLMGVPITFMLKYSPDQFEIIGSRDDFPEMKLIGDKKNCLLVNGKKKYFRIIIKHKERV